MRDAPWYDEGLRFTCTRCGRCCGGGPGTIRVSDAEIADLAAHLGLDEEEFRERYTRRLRGGDVSLLEKDDYDCVFHDRKIGCTVYARRPRQCRTWPFWRAVVHSPETWNEEAKKCPGIGIGRLHGPEEIAEMLREDGTSASRKRVRSSRRRSGQPGDAQQIRADRS